MAHRVALVTGADNPRGIGRACVRALAEAGFEVACTIEPSRGLVEGPQEAALVVPADLAEPGAPVRLLDAVGDVLGPVAALVNNAAVSERDGFEHLDAATLDRHHAVNVRATALLSCEVARRLGSDPALRIPGRIVSLTSGQFLGPMPGELAYTATKGAIEAFTRQLAAEVAHLGITVNAVGPGPTDTGWIDDALRAELVERFPARRIGEPADAARLVTWLCSPDAGWVTGQVIHSEGGFRR